MGATFGGVAGGLVEKGAVAMEDNGIAVGMSAPFNGGKSDWNEGCRKKIGSDRSLSIGGGGWPGKSADYSSCGVSRWIIGEMGKDVDISAHEEIFLRQQV